MAKTNFEIGEKEKHTLTVDWSLVMKRARIELDGEKLTEEYIYWPGGSKFSYDIGTSEVHKVEVRVGGFTKLKVLVDGKPVKSSST